MWLVAVNFSEICNIFYTSCIGKCRGQLGTGKSSKCSHNHWHIMWKWMSYLVASTTAKETARIKGYKLSVTRRVSQVVLVNCNMPPPLSISIPSYQLVQHALLIDWINTPAVFPLRRTWLSAWKSCKYNAFDQATWSQYSSVQC